MNHSVLETLRALGDPTRLRLLGIFVHGEFTVQELTVILSMGQSRISRHLKILSDVGLVSVKRQGTWGYYRIAEDNPFFREIRPALERRLDEIPERRMDLSALTGILDARRRRSRDFFDLHARQWDRLALEVLPLPEYRPSLIELVPSVERLVEIGVGTGSLLPDLRRKAAAVVGVDHSPAMLEQARERLASAGVKDVDLRLGEMSHLPLSDGEMEGALLNMVLHHAPQPARVLKEIGRILTPGGTLVVADLTRHEREWTRDRMADLWLGFEREELFSWLTEAGFEMPTFRKFPGHGEELEVFLLTARRTKPILNRISPHNEKGAAEQWNQP